MGLGATSSSTSALVVEPSLLEHRCVMASLFVQQRDFLFLSVQQRDLSQQAAHNYLGLSVSLPSWHCTPSRTATTPSTRRRRRRRHHLAVLLPYCFSLRNLNASRQARVRQDGVYHNIPQLREPRHAPPTLLLSPAQHADASVSNTVHEPSAIMAHACRCSPQILVICNSRAHVPCTQGVGICRCRNHGAAHVLFHNIHVPTSPTAP